MKISENKKNFGIREFDKMYLKENRKYNPKEYFKFIVGYVSGYINTIKTPSILDIGCATGDFLYYVSTLYSEAELSGLDAMEELLEHAKKEVSGAKFYLGDIFNNLNLPERQFDLVFMSGVNDIYDTFEPWINNILKLTSGRAYVFGIFNPEDVDVLVKTRHSGDSTSFKPGWNLFSKKSISIYLDSLNIEHKFINWDINIDIEKNINEPLRSWTFKDNDGKRLIINGTQLIHRFYLLEIIKNK